jgi:isochorismate hydrolase
LAGYQAASQILTYLSPTSQRRIEPEVWTSHEALLLDYEVPMLRRDRGGRLALTSTHWPWIGERTRQLEGAHVGLLADVVNPVACKVGPRMEVDELLALCARLDSEREPGRLALIARMGADAAMDLLPPLVAAVRAAGHPVIWLVDPMHANTVTTTEGRKTRVVETLVREVTAFQTAVRSVGGIPGGIHLETTPDDVTECVDALNGAERIGEKYTTLCDPRLNPRQAVLVVSAWRGQTMNQRGGKSMPGIAPIPAYPLPTTVDLPANTAQWDLEPHRAVLLVHDMQRYFLAPFPPLIRDPLVRHCALLRERCAALDVPVFFTAQPGGMSEQQRGLLKDFWGPGMRVDPLDRQIVDELAPRPVDRVLTKWRYSAFFRSNLLTLMREQDRDQLIICGVYAHVGVLMTAVEAFTNDIQPFLVADAIGDFSAEQHRMALDYAASRCSVVTTTEEVFQ